MDELNDIDRDLKPQYWKERLYHIVEQCCAREKHGTSYVARETQGLRRCPVHVFRSECAEAIAA